MVKTILFFLSFVYGVCTPLMGSPMENKPSCNVSYYFDESGTMGIDTIEHTHFSPLKTSSFSFGPHQDKLWLKIVVSSHTTSTPLILTINESFYEIADLYTKRDGAYTVVNNGLLRPIQQREVKSKLLSFRIEHFKGEKTYFLHLEGKYNYLGNVLVMDENEFYQHELFHSTLVYGVVFGLFVTLCVMNFLFYYSMRKKLYLYYALYAFFMIIYMTMITGMLSYIGLQRYIYEIFASGPLATVAFILFTREALKTQTKLPLFHRWSKVLYLPLIVLALVVMVQYNPTNTIINIYILLVNIILFVVALIVYLRGFNSKLYLFGLVAYLIHVAIAVCMSIGVLEYTFFTRNAMMFGIIIEAVSFQFLIIKKYQKMKLEYVTLQDEMDSLHVHNMQQLETQVTQRTQQLEELLSGKERVIKEIHHRVKNNFHSLIGLLWMEDEENNTQKNKELINHLKAVSKIHEHLCVFDNIESVNLGRYIDDILYHLHTLSSGNITINNTVEDVIVNFETAMSIGVVINEVITNSIKHSHEQGELMITVDVHVTTEMIQLTICDNNVQAVLLEDEGLGTTLVKHFISLLIEPVYEYTYDQGNIFQLHTRRITNET